MTTERRRTRQDRRNNDRVVSIFAVKSAVGPDMHLGQCEDLAPAGMSLRRPGGLPLAMGMPVMLWFELPGYGEEIAAQAVVVSDQRAGKFRRTGLRFANVAPESVRKIEMFCRMRLRPGAGEPVAAGAWM
ncbi:MAG: PilZ domain-containing protein [Deltaproteobacteria bacterium]|nr:PilZ domain-containing protein [Deltaproteobacteria bacterium]